jgi:hypothetical protein
MPHPLKEGSNDQHWRTLPEICMVLHMEHTGSADVLTREQYDEAVRYVDGRVDHWKPTRNGRSSYIFDQQVLGMCLVVLDEAKNYAKRFGPAEIKA